MARPERIRLGDLLVQQGLITAEQLAEALLGTTAPPLPDLSTISRTGQTFTVDFDQAVTLDTSAATPGQFNYVALGTPVAITAIINFFSLAFRKASIGSSVLPE